MQMVNRRGKPGERFKEQEWMTETGKILVKMMNKYEIHLDSKLGSQATSLRETINDEVADLPMTMNDRDTKDSSKNGA